MRFLPSILLSLIVLGSPAFACDKFLTIDPQQQKEDFAVLQLETADQIDRITAFNTLICSDQVAVRRKALQDGLSATPEIRSEVIFRALAGSMTINIRLLDSGGLSDAHYDYIRSNPFVSHEVKFSDAGRSCVSLYHNDRCDGGYAFSVRGDQVDYRYNDNMGSFRLTDGKLSGEVSLEVGRERLTFPAEIILF